MHIYIERSIAAVKPFGFSLATAAAAANPTKIPFARCYQSQHRTSYNMCALPF